MTLRIEPLSPDALEALAELERECFNNPWSLDALAAELSNPLAVLYAARLDETLAGYAGMHHILDEGHIMKVAASPACRRQGVASALLNALAEYAAAHELKLLTLEVRPSNRAAVSLYEAHGFRRAGERRAYYRNPVEDALILTRIL